MSQQFESNSPRAELPMRLTRLRVKNFRSIADIDIPLSPLTVLVGPNGSGKSNVVDALRFVRDVFARGLGQAVKKWGGINVVKRWSSGKEGVSIGVTMHWPQLNRTDKFTTSEGVKEVPVEFPTATVHYDFTINTSETNLPTVTSEFLVVEIPDSDTGGVEILRKDRELKIRLGNLAWNQVRQSGVASVAARVRNEDTELWSPKGLMEGVRNHNYGSTELENQPWFLHFWYKALGFTSMTLDQLFYSFDLKDLSQFQSVAESTPFDEKGINLSAVLRHLFQNNGPDWDSLQFALRRAIAGFSTLKVEEVGDYLSTKLIYQTDTTQPRTSYLGQESDGTIRMLGLLAALYQDPAQPFLSIEEPEANIHPGALAVLAGVLDEASLRSQVLVTTHSPDLLDHLPVESFLVVEKIGDTTHVGSLDASQVASVRKRLFTPGELLRMEGLQRQTTPDTAA